MLSRLTFRPSIRVGHDWIYKINEPNQMFQDETNCQISTPHQVHYNGKQALRFFSILGLESCKRKLSLWTEFPMNYNRKMLLTTSTIYRTFVFI